MPQESQLYLKSLSWPLIPQFLVHLDLHLELQSLPNPPQDPPKWSPNRKKSYLLKSLFFEAFFNRIFSIFDFKIHRFSTPFWILWPSFAEMRILKKCWFSLGKTMIFKVSTFKKTTKIKRKTHQNEDVTKTRLKLLQKSILGRILASQTRPKSRKHRPKNYQKTMSK